MLQIKIITLVKLNIGEVGANEDFGIAVNGPSIGSSDGVIKEALDMLFAGKTWHFLKTSSDTRLKKFLNDSKVIGKIANKSSKLSFMQ